MDNIEIVKEIALDAKEAYLALNVASTEQKNQALLEATKLLEGNQSEIVAANNLDVENAKQAGKDAAFIDRLVLNKDRIAGICSALTEISKLDDPVGKVTFESQRPNGLTVKRVTIALGVIGIIYESRPNVTADAWALCLKSGNAAILRPGSESFNTSKKIMEFLQQALVKAGLPETAVQILPSSDRELVDAMLSLDEYIDVIVPRGGKNLIKAVSEKSKIPVFKHLDGNCHTYIHKNADLDRALEILYNAKLRRTGICGATESVLIDEEILSSIVPLIEQKFTDSCEIRADEQARQFANSFKEASEADYGTEYLDSILSIKSVKNIDEAIKHINSYSSGHTEAIITEDDESATKFLNGVDSAIVMHNTSTQFADGGEFGLGAEIGISTGRMHARGPVGLEQLVTYKYQVFGNGQTRP